MAVTVESIGAYLYLESDVITDDTDLIQGFINGALDEVRDATGKALIETETSGVINNFDLAVTMLAAHRYMNRGIISDKSSYIIPEGYDMLIKRISLSSAYV